MQERLPKTLISFFWHFVKPYKLFLFGTGFVACYWGLVNSILPYVLKLIIDRIAEFEADKSLIFDAVKYLVILYIALWIGMASVMRLLDWIYLRLFPALRKDIVNAMFAHLNRHSYSYFQNNFAGSLSNKISDMTRGITSIFQVIDEAFAQSIGVLVAITTMFIVHPVFACIFLIWTFSFITIAYCFSKSIQVFSIYLPPAKQRL